MTEHCGIWVGFPVTSSKDMAQNTQATFVWVSNVEKIYLGYLCFIFYQKWTRLLNERTVSSSNTIQSLATIRTVTMYVFFFDFEVRVASEPVTRIKQKLKKELKQKEIWLCSQGELRYISLFKEQNNCVHRKAFDLFEKYEHQYCRPAACGCILGTSTNAYLVLHFKASLILISSL